MWHYPFIHVDIFKTITLCAQQNAMYEYLGPDNGISGCNPDK